MEDNSFSAPIAYEMRIPEEKRSKTFRWGELMAIYMIEPDHRLVNGAPVFTRVEWTGGRRVHCVRAATTSASTEDTSESSPFVIPGMIEVDGECVDKKVKSQTELMMMPQPEL